MNERERGYVAALFKYTNPENNAPVHAWAHIVSGEVHLQQREKGKDMTTHFVENLRDTVPTLAGMHTKAIDHLCGWVPEKFKRHRIIYEPFSDEEVETVRCMLRSLPSPMPE